MVWPKPNAYQTGSSDRRKVTRKTIEIAEEIGAERIVEHARHTLELNQETGRLEMLWDNQKQTRSEASSKAVATDNEIDKTLSSIEDVIDAKAGMATESRERRLAREMREALFPAGVRPVTSMRYGEQHARVQDIIDRVEVDFGDHVHTLGLETMVQSLEELNETFGEQIELREVDEVSYDEVQAARAEGREAYHTLLYMICAEYYDDPETRARLLEPARLQNERIGRYIGRQTDPPPADPESGEPTEPTGPEGSNDGRPDGGQPTDPEGDSQGGSGDGSQDAEPTDSEGDTTDQPDDEEA